MDDQAALRKRKSTVRDSDLSSGLVFQAVIDHLKAKRGDAVIDKLKKERGLPRSTVGLLKYPADKLISLLDGALDELRSVEKRDDGQLLEQLGACTVEPWLNSSLGAVLISLNGGNAHRVLSSAGTAFRTTHTFGELSYEKLGDRGAQVLFKGFLLGPAYAAGILRVALKKVGQVEPDIQVTNSQQDGRDFTLTFKW